MIAQLYLRISIFPFYIGVIVFFWFLVYIFVVQSMIYPRESWEKGEHTTLWGTIWSIAFVPGSTDSNLKDAAVVVLVVLLHRCGCYAFHCTFM